MKNKKKSQGGFTFMEVLIAMMIVFILAGTAGFTYLRYISNARETAAMSQIKTFEMALNAYYLDNSRFPATEQGLNALWEKPVSEPVPQRWNGPYLTSAVPLDPWGYSYVYETPGPHGLEYGISSLGADGQSGGEKGNADINSWD